MKTLNNISPSYRMKCIVVGDSSVGKSSFVKLFAENELDSKVSSTIGVGFFSRIINLDNHEIILQIWDTAGQDRFLTLTKAYMRDSFICFYVFDMTNIKSFLNLDKWREKVDDVKSHTKLPLNILVGTKSDLRNHQVSYSQVDEKAKEWGCQRYIITTVQENSFDVIYRMFYKSSEECNNLMLTMDQELVPKLVKASVSFLELDIDIKKHNCCY